MTWRVITGRNLPTRLPLWQTGVLYLLLAHFHPSGWVVGVIWTLWGLRVAVALFAMLNQHPVDVIGPAEYAAKMQDANSRVASALKN